jgi:hypothetical protein
LIIANNWLHFDGEFANLFAIRNVSRRISYFG